MYAMTGTLIAKAGKRGEFIEILLQAAAVVGSLPGCHMYAVGEDSADETTTWVVEIWEDKNTHDQSLQREDVRTLIAKAMPLMEGVPHGAELRLVGGYGILGIAASKPVG